MYRQPTKYCVLCESRHQKNSDLLNMLLVSPPEEFSSQTSQIIKSPLEAFGLKRGALSCLLSFFAWRWGRRITYFSLVDAMAPKSKELLAEHFKAARCSLNVLDLPESGCFGHCKGACYCSSRCKNCLRSFGSEHPLETRTNKDVHDTLPRAGGKGLHCDICRMTFHHYHKDDSPQERKQRMEDIQADPEKRKAHCSEVADYQELKNDPRNARRVTQNVSLSCNEHHTVGAEKELGMLWPTAIWEEFFKKKAAAWRLTQARVGINQWATGIIEAPSAGWAPGIYRLKEEYGLGITKKARGPNTDDGYTEDEVNKAAGKFSEALTVDVQKESNADGEDSIKLVGGGVDADDDQNDFLSDYLSAGFGPAPEDNDQQDRPQKKLKETKPLDSTPKAGTPKRPGGEPEEQRPPKAGKRETPKPKVASKPKAQGPMSRSKRLKEFNTTENLVNEAQNLFKRLRDYESFMFTKAPVLESLCVRLDKRLDPSLLDQFEGDLMGVYEQVRAAKDLAKALTSILVCCHAKPGSDEYLPILLQQAISDFTAIVRSGGATTDLFELPQQILALPVLRHLESAISSACSLVAKDTTSAKSLLEDWSRSMSLAPTAASKALDVGDELGLNQLSSAAGPDILNEAHLKAIDDGLAKVFGMKVTVPEGSLIIATREAEFIKEFLKTLAALSVPETIKKDIAALEKLMLCTTVPVDEIKEASTHCNNNAKLAVLLKNTPGSHSIGGQIGAFAWGVFLSRKKDQHVVSTFVALEQRTSWNVSTTDAFNEALVSGDLATRRRLTAGLKETVLGCRAALQKASDHLQSSPEYLRIKAFIEDVDSKAVAFFKNQLERYALVWESGLKAAVEQMNNGVLEFPFAKAEVELAAMTMTGVFIKKEDQDHANALADKLTKDVVVFKNGWEWYVKVVSGLDTNTTTVWSDLEKHKALRDALSIIQKQTHIQELRTYYVEQSLKCMADFLCTFSSKLRSNVNAFVGNIMAAHSCALLEFSQKACDLKKMKPNLVVSLTGPKINRILGETIPESATKVFESIAKADMCSLFEAVTADTTEEHDSITDFHINAMSVLKMMPIIVQVADRRKELGIATAQKKGHSVLLKIKEIAGNIDNIDQMFDEAIALATRFVGKNASRLLDNVRALRKSTKDGIVEEITRCMQSACLTTVQDLIKLLPDMVKLLSVPELACDAELDEQVSERMYARLSEPSAKAWKTAFDEYNRAFDLPPRILLQLGEQEQNNHTAMAALSGVPEADLIAAARVQSIAIIVTARHRPLGSKHSREDLMKMAFGMVDRWAVDIPEALSSLRAEEKTKPIPDGPIMKLETMKAKLEAA